MQARNKTTWIQRHWIIASHSNKFTFGQPLRSLLAFPTITSYTHDCGKNYIWHRVRSFPVQLLLNLHSTQMNSATSHKFSWLFMWSACYLSHLNQTWIPQQISVHKNRKTVLPAERLLHAERQTDRQTDMTKLPVPFRKFATESKTIKCSETLRTYVVNLCKFVPHPFAHPVCCDPTQ